MKGLPKQPKLTRAEIEQRLEEVTEKLSSGKAAGSEYFKLVEERAKLSVDLDDYELDFDAPKQSAPSGISYQIDYSNKGTILHPEQLVAEIDKLIDKNPPQSELEVVLPYLAQLAGRHTLDVRRLYDSRLLELEESEAKDDLKQDLDDLLAIGGESLNLSDFFPAALAEPLTGLAQRMAIRPEVFLLALLVGISSLHKIGTNLIVSYEDKFIVPPNLFGAIVAESGQKKSPVLRTLVQCPLDALEDATNVLIKYAYEEDLEEYRSLDKEERKERFPKGEPTLNLVDYYFTEGTVEGINRQFARFPTRGMLYLRDELAGVFAFDKHRGGRGSERQDFLSFYDGSGKKELLADGFVSRVKKVLLSIFGTIQPRILQNLMRDPDDSDGQWARFLFVIQPLQAATLGNDSNYDINSELINPLYRKVDELPVRTYHFEPEAKESFIRQYHKLEHLRVTHPEPALRAVFSKMEGIIGRLAVNLHVIHELVGQDVVAVSQAIPKARVVEAGKLARFFIGQVKLIYATAKTDDASLAPGLAAIVERSHKVGEVTARDIKRSVRSFRDSSVQEIRSLFRELETMGYGDCSGDGLHLKFLARSIKQEDQPCRQHLSKIAETINVDNHEEGQNGSNIGNIHIEHLHQENQNP